MRYELIGRLLARRVKQASRRKHKRIDDIFSASVLHMKHGCVHVHCGILVTAALCSGGG